MNVKLDMIFVGFSFYKQLIKTLENTMLSNGATNEMA